jgi:hypothetical protein
MPLTFENNYVVGVVIFMITLLFCKNVLECLQSFVLLWQNCTELLCKDVLFCPCVHHGHAELVRISMLALLLTFSVGQPLFLLLARSVVERMTSRKSLWTVNLAYLQLNETAFQHSKNGSDPLDSTCILDSMVSSSCYEVDGLLLVMPFSLTAACSTWMWVSLKQTGFFDSDPRWDADLFSDPRMQLYELFYGMELFHLIFATLTMIADPAPVQYVLVYALLTSFLMLFFCAKSRNTSSGEGMENIIGMFMFSVLSTLISLFVAQNWVGSCLAKHGSAALLIILFPFLAIIHISTTEATRAGYIILTRTCFSSVFSLYFLTLASVNPNMSC